MGLKIKCKYLVKIGNFHHCRIYKHKDRINKVLWTIKGHKFYCCERVKSRYDYESCPYNTDKPIIGDGVHIWYQNKIQFMDEEIKNYNEI